MSSTTALRGILARGGDSRLDLDAAGMNRYGCGFEPDLGLLSLGSCTGSTVSSVAFRALATELEGRSTGLGDLHAWASTQQEHTRTRLHELLLGGPSSAEVVLTPSGTDAEYLPLVLACVRARGPVTNVVIAPDEVGSGTVLAASGRHFDAVTPSGERVGKGSPIPIGFDVRTVTVGIRTEDGRFRAPAAVDEEVSGIVDRAVAAKQAVVVHVVAHSKTGVHAPSLACVASLEREHGDRLTVVIDAAQGRISRTGLRASIAANRLIMLTGSKFYGGPPFSGAVLMPAAYAALMDDTDCPAPLASYFAQSEVPERFDRWRTHLRPEPNVGLAARWFAAMVEIERYYDVPGDVRLDVLRSFEDLAPRALGAFASIDVEVGAPIPTRDESTRLLESKLTVLSFSAVSNGRRLGADQLRQVQRELRAGVPVVVEGNDVARLEIGQPVQLGLDKSVLRVALGGRSVLRWSQPATASERRSLIERDLDVVGRSIEAAVRRIRSAT